MSTTLVYICDDESVWLNQLTHMISNYTIKSNWALSIGFSALSPTALLQHLQEHTPNGGIYFLDMIYGAQMNGIELGQNIRRLDSNAVLIYVTHHEEMMRETFRLKLQVFDYILKDDKDICEQVYQCLNHLEHSCQLHCVTSSRIVVQSSNFRHILLEGDIYYIDTVKGAHKLQIHTKHDSIVSATSLSSLKQQLPDTFLTCGRGILVNTQHITSVNCHTKELLLDNGDTCPCSARMWHSILKRLDIGQDSPIN